MTWQDYFGFVILALFILFFIWSVLIMYRNSKVYKFTITVASMVHDNIQSQINELDLDEINLALETFRSVSYDRMLYRFWIPLKIQYWWTDEELKDMFPKYKPTRKIEQ